MAIIFQMLAWIGYSILTLIVIIAIKDLIGISKYLKYYKNQNIKLFYTPWIGYFQLFSVSNHRDTLNNYSNYLNKTYKDEELICYTEADSDKIGVMIKSQEILKDFFIKEAENTKRVKLIDGDFTEGFFFKAGHRAMMVRGLFNNLFLPENLKNITPLIRKKMDDFFKNLIEEKWENKKIKKSEFIEINMKEELPKLMSIIVNEILFGESKNSPKVDGMILPEAVEKFLHTLYGKIMRNPLNMISFGLLHKLGLFSATKETAKLKDKIMNSCQESIRKRQTEAKVENLGCNLLDLLIKHNLTASPEEKIDLMEMTANSIGLIGAAQDTSISSTELLLEALSNRPKIVKRIVEEELPMMFKNKEDKDNYDCYFKSNYLAAVLTENLRRDSPAPCSFARVATKNFKLGKYKIYKGTKIVIDIHGFHTNEALFENHQDFDEMRFYEEERKKKIPKIVYLPFSGGKRACIGKYLAELDLRIFVSSFFEHFEMKTYDDREDGKTVLKFVKGIDKLNLMLRPKQA